MPAKTLLTQQDKVILTYDEQEVWSQNPKYYGKHAYEYAEDIQFYQLQTYEELGECLIETAQKISHYACCYWRIEARDHSRSIVLPYGDMGAEMIRAFAPSGDFSFTLSKGTWQEGQAPSREILIVDCTHHDAPRGGDRYYLIPLTLQEYDENGGDE